MMYLIGGFWFVATLMLVVSGRSIGDSMAFSLVGTIVFSVVAFLLHLARELVRGVIKGEDDLPEVSLAVGWTIVCLVIILPLTILLKVDYQKFSIFGGLIWSFIIWLGGIGALVLSFIARLF